MCFNCLVLRRRLSPDWTEPASAPTGVRGPFSLLFYHPSRLSSTLPEQSLLATVPPSEFPLGTVVAAVVAVLLVALCVTGLYLWKRRDTGKEQV